MNTSDLALKNRICKMFAGSIAYGTNTPESDVDYRGIFVADKINIQTPFFPVRESEDSTEEDTKYFELSHFMKLCLDCNPNIIELLWTDDDDIEYSTDAFRFLQNHREEFLSTKIAYTTSGYAMSQLKRIKGHHKWINNPQPIEKPEQHQYITMVQSFYGKKMMPRDFDITVFADSLLVSYGGGIYGIYDENGNLLRPDGSLNPNSDRDVTSETPMFIIKFNKEEWISACEKWTNYWKWKNNRNEARSALEEAYGFDTKHAMHLIRLLKMGVETLRDHEVIIKRPDAQELLDIRNGSLDYNELMQYAGSLEEQITKHLKSTTLRKKPNIKLAASVMMHVQEMVWSWK